jgi:hypothetical protein
LRELGKPVNTSVGLTAYILITKHLKILSLGEMLGINRKTTPWPLKIY